MSTFLLVVSILAVFVGLVVAHEWGHFIFARRNGVDVEEFAIGFPPRIWTKKMKSGFNFSFNLIPLGGYVKMKGEHDADTAKGTFGAASIGAKIRIMAAGVGMNLLVAFVIFTFLAVIGVPQLVLNQFTIKSDTTIVNKQTVTVISTQKGSPAASIGLKPKDVLISMQGNNGQFYEIDNDLLLPGVTQALQGQNVKVTYKLPNGQVKTANVAFRSGPVVNASQNGPNPIGYFGVSTSTPSSSVVMQKSTWSAPIVALGLMKQITILTFKGIGSALASVFKGHPSQATAQVTGPVGVVVILKNGSLLGIHFVLAIIAIISLSLALINILPIPALDGGRIFFTVVPRLIRGKPLKQRTEDIINGVGLAFVFLLIISISAVEIKNLF